MAPYRFFLVYCIHLSVQVFKLLRMLIRVLSHLSTLSGLLEALHNNNALLDQIQKCLEAYLESKRVVFPRYVLSTVLS